MDKSLIGHGMLAVATTITAYMAYAAPNITKSDGDVLVFAGTADTLNRIDWEDETGTVELSRDGDGVFVATHKKSVAAVPNKLVANATAPSPTDETQIYPGTEQAKEMFDKLAPLKAARSLGQLPAEKLKSLGLETPKSKLVLHFGNTESTLEVGGTAFGTGDYYGRSPDGTIYLLRSSTLSSLGHGAISLQDRDAVGLPRGKFDQVTIKYKGHERQVSQRHGDDPAKAFFADPADPDRKLEQLSGWLDRVLRLRVTELANETPAGEPALTVEFSKDKDSAVGSLRVWPVGDKGSLAISTHFKTPIVLFKGGIEAVLRDAESALNDGK